MIMVGQKAPDFQAPGYHNGKFVSMKLSESLGKWTLLCFIRGISPLSEPPSFLQLLRRFFCHSMNKKCRHGYYRCLLNIHPETMFPDEHYLAQYWH